MSNFLPDIANWALRGARNESSDDDDDNEEEEQGTTLASDGLPILSAEQVREQRLARMMQANTTTTAEQDGTQPMEIDSNDSSKRAKTTAQASSSFNTSSTNEVAATKPAPKSEISSEDASRKKLQRKKELLLQKILLISLSADGNSNSNNNNKSCVVLESLSGTDISVQNIAEILATRLSLSPDDPMLIGQRSLMAYLGQSHRKAGDEIKTLQQRSETGKNNPSELLELLQEIQKQVVSYAASCLMEPDLFELGANSSEQLLQCLASSVTDLNNSITVGVQGNASSFYYMLIEEIIQQDAEHALESFVKHAADSIMESLSKVDSVLDSNIDGSPVVLVSTLSAMCIHKRVAVQLATQYHQFLLPAAGTPEAAETVHPSLNNNPNGLWQMLTGGLRSYVKRSGPGLEKHTLLGAALSKGLPKSNPAFPPTSVLRHTVDAVKRTNSSQRLQLKNHQDACFHFIMSLIKGGASARNMVMQWFTDALLVNVHANAMRPDQTKVSSTNMLMNMSVALFKLCDPFVNDAKKHGLIDPRFVMSTEHHKGVFALSGEDAVARLGESVQDDMVDSYNPKNAFIPQCFFLCARSLHFGIVPQLAYHENLLRHISHAHHEITANNRDLQSDPNFTHLVSRQQSNEVGLFQEDMVTDTLRFCNLMAKVLWTMSDDVLRTMPEDFVSDMCNILMSIAKLKGKLLQNGEYGFVFKLVVKLLSPTYASMVRNYNLRAMLGDVLYELFLPTTGKERRDIPASVSADPSAGGRCFLLADATAQESLAPSLLLLYGEVEHTGHYDKMSHRAKIAALIKFLWDSSEHRPAFRRITRNKNSFIKFANGIMNETNTLIATVMQKLPEIREAQEMMRNPETWGVMSEDEQAQVTSRLDDNEREVKYSLPLCNKTLQMFGYLNTDADIRALFLLEELRSRLVTMLLHVLTKLVGSKGLDLKVDNPEQYDFRPKEMLRDLCAIFALFAPNADFQTECAKAGCDPNLLRSAVKTCKRLNLLTGESIKAFESLPDTVDAATQNVAADEALLADAPDEFLDEILSTFMKDPVMLPSHHYVDRSTITQHLLNDPTDPFSREAMTVDDIKPATELKARMDAWLAEKVASNSK